MAEGIIKPFGGRSKRRWVNRRYRLLLNADTAPSDADYANVILRVNAEGTHGAQDAIDHSDSAHTLVYGTAAVQVTNAQEKFGDTSIICPNAAGGSLGVANHGDFDVNAQSWTYEMFVYPLDVTETGMLAGQWHSALATHRNWILFSQATVLSVIVQLRSAGTTNTQSTAIGALTQDQWQHVALQYEAGWICIWVDGVVKKYVDTGVAALRAPQVPFEMGDSANNSGFPLNGYIDDVRYTVGAVRYTMNTAFTPPTETFPTQ